jgi:uncharacterized SAM-binding protein YcdF (DUF218 family)
MYEFVVALFRPFTLLLLVTLVWTALLWRRGWLTRKSLAVLTVLLALLVIVCSPWLGYLAVWSLERPYPPREDMPAGVDTMVVLSGALRVYDEAGGRVQPTADTTARCRLILSGGKVDPQTPGPTLARAMEDFLVQLGVDPADIVLEEASRNTYENALNTAAILQERHVKRIVLVTDAAHMYRASGCFRAQGIEVVPSACNHRAGWAGVTAASFLPDPGGAAGLQTASHEWLGILWYWLNGRF